MPQTRSTTRRRLATLVVALATVATGFVAGGAPAEAAPPTEAPTILGPDGTTVGANPILSWEPLPDVVKYRVEVFTNSNYSGTAAWKGDVTNTTATPNTDLPLGTLHWRVAGMEVNTPGPFANASFTRDRVAGPVPIAPGDGAVLEHPEDPVVLRWEPVAGVKNYKVEVDDAADFINPLQSATTDITSWALPTTQTLGQTFYWRVQGQGSLAGVNTEFSPTQSYQLAWAANGTPSVPELTAPAPGATVSDVAFRWNPVPGAAKYELQVSPNGDWASTSLSINVTVKGTAYSPPVTLKNASYFWRVRALSPRTPADAGPWSPDGRQFTRAWADVPAQEYPDDNDLETNDYLLRWDPVPLASGYELQVGTDPNFSPNTFRTCTTVHTDWSPYWRQNTQSEPAFPPRAGDCLLADDIGNRRTFLRQGVQYYWRVRGVDLSDVSGTVPTVLGRFSDTRNFMYLPGVPSPTGPFSGSVQVPKLSWTAVPGVERYEVDVFVDGEPHIQSMVHGTSWVPPITHKKDSEGVPLPASVSWTVRALQFGATGGSSNGAAGPTVSGPSFTLSAIEAGGGSSPTLAAPAAGAASVHPEFDWAPVSGAHHYRVVIFPSGSGVGTELVDPEQGTSGSRRFSYRSAFTPIKPIAPGNYDWQVTAYTEGNGFIASSPRRAITISELQLVTPTAPDDCSEGSACTVHPATPLMQWNEVPWAAYYRVHLAIDGEFTNVRHIYTTTQTSLRPYEALPDNQAGQSYHWFVQPCRSTDVCGRFNSSVFGTGRAFRKGSRPITLLSPADGTRVANQITFSWQPVSASWVGSDDDDDLEAEYYKIDVSRTADFTGTLLDTAKVDQTTYTSHAKTYDEGPIYWRVQAYDSTGNNLTSSPIRVVHKSSPLPEITSPTTNAQVAATPLVRWEPQPFAAKYEIEYYKNGDTSWTPTNKVVPSGQPNPRRTDLAADALPVDLAPGTYAYRVRRIDVDGKAGPWSSDPPPPSTNPADGDRRTFTIVGQAPDLTAPANDAVYSRPRIRLEWEPVPGAASYQVQTSMAGGFGTLVENVNTVMTTFSLVKAHVTGTIHWRVSALDGQGNVLGTSEVRRIVQDLSRPTSSLPKVVAGPASVLVSWVGTPAAASGPITSYVITPYVGAVKGTPVTVGGDVNEVRMTDLVNDTTYKFTVTPYDANGIGIPSQQSAAVKPTKLAPFTTVDRFITRQYQDFVGRNPTSAELTQARTQLQGSMTPEAFINSLWTSTAQPTSHANVMPQITRLYSAFYLRIPDADGLIYWAGERRKSVSLATVAEKFTQVQEFRTLYGTKTNAQYVDLVYENVLDRAPSAADRTYWKGQLDSGKITRGRLMIGFSESAEYKNKYLHEINAAMVYIEMIRKTPTTAQRDALVDAFEGGQTLPETFLELMGSAAYAARGGL